MKRYSFIAGLVLISFIQGCAHLKTGKPVDNNEIEKTTLDSSEAPDYRDFSQDQDTLYDLLIAEIASQRQQFDITLVNYIHQARVTKDPAIILRAINAAQIAKDQEAIKELALVWLENEPDNIGAHQLLTYQYSIDEEFEAAFEHLDRILELDGQTNVEALAITSSKLNEEDRTRLLNLYEELLTKHPDRWEVRYSLALVQRTNKQCDAAIENLNQVIKEQDEFQQAYIVKANCLNELSPKDDKEAATAFTEDAFDSFPNNNALGRLYASLLISQNKTDEAEDVFSTLLEYYPDSPSLLLSHALLMLENQNAEGAKADLSKIIELESNQKNDAYYYLARIAEQEKDNERAIENYQKVSGGTHFNSSLERSSYLLGEAGRIDEAIERLTVLRSEKPENAVRYWLVQYQLLADLDQKERALKTLNDAVVQFPNEEKLLYARAMHYDSIGELPLMEADLRNIIQNNPKNAIALNALGYTLADKTTRYEEALGLITAAYALLPENPAIMDSMGWILFKVGQHDKALQLLAMAYSQYPDGEVGAHLGEVLWVKGEREKASAIWGENFGRQPKHPILLETIQRLAPELLELAKQAHANHAAQQAANDDVQEQSANKETQQAKPDASEQSDKAIQDKENSTAEHE